ncbi:MAG: UvrB/UvrC motif-containing protein [Candidatus Latescibacteria bacterium]|nr:UvrB/UvrC motif-containing protein [Candidatus Latescibacterota bacterium]
MNVDIGDILTSWPYDPDDDLIVRIVDTPNGPKLQMRIDMGLIQMEIDHHPAGESPGGFESWLEYYENEQIQYDSGKVDDYFSLSGDDCKLLRREGVQYYYRYLSLMKIEDYERVVRDTDRNIRLFGFVKKYASSEMDRWALDQFRPYVIMINTRARVSITLKNNPSTGIEKAIELFDRGIGEIISFYKEYGISAEIDSSVELSVLKALKNEFLRKSPPTLEEELRRAISEERFEDAVLLRDRLRDKHKEN